MKLRRNKKVVVAMSGGVDSSLAAALLKREGYDVIGVTFKMWPKEECGASWGRACCNLEAVTRARAVAGSLKIPYYVMDFHEDFKKEVIDYFALEYLKGLTPNPCVICNNKIKFGLLMQKAQALGANMIATGHYAKVQFDKRRKRFLLKEGRDKSKEQSYFLFGLSQGQLAHTIFPLSNMTKAKVRMLAKRLKLRTFNTASSQDICFIQDLNYADYIKKTGVEIKTGEIVDEKGNVLGYHKGIPYYTIGQRRGLGIAHSEPLYVTAIDIRKNRLIVGTKKDVMKKRLIAHQMNWISIEKVKRPLRIEAKIRYNHKKADCTVKTLGEAAVMVEFDSPQEAPTPGQAIVFYDRDVVVGGGWIREI